MVLLPETIPYLAELMEGTHAHAQPLLSHHSAHLVHKVNVYLQGTVCWCALATFCSVNVCCLSCP